LSAIFGTFHWPVRDKNTKFSILEKILFISVRYGQKNRNSEQFFFNAVYKLGSNVERMTVSLLNKTKCQIWTVLVLSASFPCAARITSKANQNRPHYLWLSHCCSRPPKTYVKPETAIKVFELLMMGGVSPETC
jgi:hypothetical protein